MGNKLLNSISDSYAITWQLKDLGYSYSRKFMQTGILYDIQNAHIVSKTSH